MTEDEEFEALEQRLNYKQKEQAMNREDIIRMAREAGYGDHMSVLHAPALERFAALVASAEREACGRVKAATPRKLKPVGRGMLLDEQQFCFDKGWREGAASVRAAIRARSKQ